MFTEGCIEKLSALRNDLVKIAHKEYEGNESSDYSKDMLNQFIEAVDALIENNDIAYWSKTKNQQWLAERVDFIDNYIGGHTPGVFNQQSLDLAIRLHAFIMSMDMDSDLKDKQELNELLGDVNSFIEHYKMNLGFDIKVYHAFSEEEALEARLNEIRKNIYEKNDHLLGAVTELTEDAHEAFLREYDDAVSSMLQELDKTELPYLLLKGAAQYVNIKNPVPFEEGAIVELGAKRALMLDVLAVESHVNDALKEKGTELVHAVYNTLSNLPLLTHRENLNKLYETVIHDYLDAADRYLAGEELKINFGIVEMKLKKPDPFKEALIKDLKDDFATIDANKNMKAEQFRIYDSFMKVQDYIRQHEEFLKENPNLPHGDVTRILNKTSRELLNLWYKINVKNDVHFADELEEHRRKYNRDEEPIPSERTTFRPESDAPE